MPGAKHFSASGALLFVACCSTLLSTSSASDNPRCLLEQPSINRSQVELRLASHDWLTHKLVSCLAEIIFEEVLGYSVVRIYPASSKAWGPDITAGLYDLDLEQWHALPLSEEYAEYVTNQGSILDAGLVGYSGRSGLYIFRSVLERSRLADFFAFYQNSSDVAGLGLRTFRDSSLQPLLNTSFPLCELDWCGSGTFSGYWAPPVCREGPDDCIEILKATATRDEGYFEQLVKNHGLLAIFGYYGDGLEAYLRNLGNKDVMFYWWEPTLLHAQLDVVRISFPDHYQGCDSGYASDPDIGTVTCDAAEIQLRKVASRRLRDDAPQAYVTLSLLSLDQNTINDMLLLYDSLATSGQQSDTAIFAAACAHADVLRNALPSCLSDPQTFELPYVLKQEVFNPETLSCGNLTVLEELPATTCFSTPPGRVDRSHQEIRIARRLWATQALMSIVAEIVLREYLGYKVVNVVHLHRVSGMHQEWDMIDGLTDVDMENWHPEDMPPFYEAGLLHFAGLTGYDVREGLYVTKEAAERNRMAEYFKFYQNASEVAQFGFMTHAESPLHNFLSGDFPPPCSSDLDWCGTGELDGYYATPACEENPGRCIEVAMEYVGWGDSIPEQASRNWGLELVFAYYGPALWEAVPYIHSVPGRLSPFFAWEPDGSLLRFQAKRISFPDLRLGCLDGNTYNPVGPVRCDNPSIQLEKVVSNRVAAMPEALFAMEALSISLELMNALLARHVTGGGSLQSGEAACEFVKSHEELLQTWAPDCMTRPPPPEDVRVNDTVFSQQEGRCVPITCAAATILTYSSTSSTFSCEECRQGEIPDPSQRSCRSCDPGEQPDEAGVRCTPCIPGTSASANSAGYCSRCSPGWFSLGGVAACEACPAGTTSMEAASSCVACPSGTFSGSGARNCTACEAGHYAAVSRSTACAVCEIGRYASDPASTQCAQCGENSASPERYATMVKFDFQAEIQYNYVLASESAEDCGCDRGLRVDSAGECVQCTEGMECPGLGDVLILPGYYSRAAPDVSVFKCHGESGRCIGGVPGETCTKGRRGVACAECEENMKVKGSECAPCGDQDFMPFVLFVLVASAFVVLVDIFAVEGVSKQQSLAIVFCVIAFGQLVTTLQVMNIVSLLSLEWEDPFKSILRLTSMIAFNFEVLHIGCIHSLTPVEKYVSTLATLALGLVLLCVIHIVKLGALRCRRASIRNRCWSLVAAVSAILMLFYIPVASMVLQPLQCKQHPNGVWTVWGYQSVVCWDSSEHTVMLMISIVTFILVPLGFLAFVITVLLQVKSRIHRMDAVFVRTFSFLFFRFRPGMHWAAVALMLKNLMLAICIAIPDALVQIIFLVSVNQAAWAVVLRLQPWRMAEAQVLDVSLTHVMLMVIVMASFYVEDDEKDFQVLSWICTIMVVMVFGAGLSAMLYNLLSRFLPRARRFEFFLCHHKAGSGAYTRLLQMILHDSSKTGGSVFIDSDHLDNLDHLFHYIRTETATFVIIASSEIFTRPWCVGEMTTARLSKVVSLLVALPGCSFPDKDFIKRVAESGLSDTDILTEAGMSARMICKTFVWIDSIPKFTMQDKLTSEEMEGMANSLQSESKRRGVAAARKRGHLMGLGKTISRRNTGGSIKPVTCPGEVYFLYNMDNIDACAACYVLRKMLIPLSEYATELIPYVPESGSLVHTEMATAIVMCTSGLLENATCVKMFAHANVHKHVSYPVLADPGFRFPPSDVYAWFAHTLSSGLEEQEILEASACITLLFKEIATAFQPNAASLSVLKVSALEVFRRVVSLKKRSSHSIHAIKSADMTHSLHARQIMAPKPVEEKGKQANVPLEHFPIAFDGEVGDVSDEASDDDDSDLDSPCSGTVSRI